MSSGDEGRLPRNGAFPRVLFGGDAPTAKLDAEARGVPRVLFGSPSGLPIKGDGPRVVAGGEIRRRIGCTVAELREIDALAADTIVRNAHRLVDAINLDDHHFDDVVRFGAVLQTRHGKLTEEQLALVSDDGLAAIRTLGADLLQILDQLDPVAVFAPARGIAGLLRAVARHEDPQAVFTRHYGKMMRIADELKGRLEEVSALAGRVASLSRRHASLDDALEAHLLAARFLVRHIEVRDYGDRAVEAHYRSQGQALAERIEKLSATSVSAKTGRMMVNSIHAAVQGIERFATDLVNEELPAWHTAYSAALLARATDIHGAGEGLARLQRLHTRLRNILAAKGQS